MSFDKLLIFEVIISLRVCIEELALVMKINAFKILLLRYIMILPTRTMERMLGQRFLMTATRALQRKKSKIDGAKKFV